MGRLLPLHRILLIILTITVLNNRFDLSNLFSTQIKGIHLSKKAESLPVLAIPVIKDELLSYNLDAQLDKLEEELESEWEEDNSDKIGSNPNISLPVYRNTGNVGVAVKPVAMVTPKTVVTPSASTSSGGGTPAPVTPSPSSTPTVTPAPSIAPTPAPEPPKEEKPTNKGQEKKEEHAGKGKG
jgi:hypothetical protein